MPACRWRWYNRNHQAKVVLEMKQKTFIDMEYSFRRKKVKREGFLETVDESIPWNE